MNLHCSCTSSITGLLNLADPQLWTHFTYNWLYQLNLQNAMQDPKRGSQTKFLLLNSLVQVSR